MNSKANYLRKALCLSLCTFCAVLSAQTAPIGAQPNTTTEKEKLDFDADPILFLINYCKYHNNNQSKFDTFRLTCSDFNLKVNPEKGFIISAESKEGGIGLIHNTFNGNNRWQVGLVKKYPYGGLEKDIDFFSSLILKHAKAGELSQLKMEYGDNTMSIRFFIGEYEGYMEQSPSGIAVFVVIK